MRLARAPEAVAGRPEGRPLPWERQASQSCQVRPEEAREPTSGTAKGSTLSMLLLRALYVGGRVDDVDDVRLHLVRVRARARVSMPRPG